MHFLRNKMSLQVLMSTPWELFNPQEADIVLQTALMYAADNLYPYCTRWLLRGHRAKVNVSSLLASHHHHHHNLDAMYFALKRFPATRAYSVGGWWSPSVHGLLCSKANPFKWQHWRETFPWPCAVIQEYVETVHTTPQHLLARTLVWPCHMHFL